MKKPSISVVSPSFNQAQYLHLMIESVCNQHFDLYEHIVLDPGSTDGSVELLKKYVIENEKAKLILEPDRGQANAINKGFARSSGEILTWLNSDDFYYDDETLSVVANFFNENPSIDVAYGRGVRVDSSGNTIKEAFVYPSGTDFTKTLEHSIGILQPSLFFRRSLYEKVGGLDEAWPLQLDYELWIRFAQSGASFGFIDKLLSKATVHENAKSTKQRLMQLAECLVLVKERFGFAAADWISRYADYHLTRVDSKVFKKVELNSTERFQHQAIEKKLHYLFNFGLTVGDQTTLSTPARNSTLKAMEALDVAPIAPQRIILTSFDSQYFQQGLNLIAGLHRTSFESFDKILIYSLGLSRLERTRLNDLEKVEVVDYPDDITQRTFAEFLDPKARAYKAFVMRAETVHIKKGDLVLWLDAGLTALQDIAKIFETVKQKGFFITDHDDSKHWPFYNISFIHQECLKYLKPSNSEILAPHLCSAIVGYKVGGQYQFIIEEAWKVGKHKNAVLWPKNIDKDKKSKVKLTSTEKAYKRDIEKGKINPDEIDRQKLFKLFAYNGHRTQSILSILAYRYNSPIFSASIFRQSNDFSSEASKINWQQSAKNIDKLSSRHNLAGVTEKTVVYHHRGIYNHLEGLRFRKNNAELFILGNGPSLRGFDFSKLKEFDSLGMNAAYRFWDESGFYPTYYACFDTVVLDSHSKEIIRLIRERDINGIGKFFLRKTILEKCPELKEEPCVFFLEDLQATVDWFSRDKITTGSFSVYVGLFLGYRKIFLLGIDLDYVEKLPEARVDGRELEITKTPQSNLNYFFDSYQAKGDRYNPPNRHPDMHLRSWSELKKFLEVFPATIINLNKESAVKDFQFETFESVYQELTSRFRIVMDITTKALQFTKEYKYWRYELKSKLNSMYPIIGPYDRNSEAHWDETKGIAEFFINSKQPGRMIDVGAHHGSAFIPFLDCDWHVYAFEPDQKNREKLLARISGHKNRDLVDLDDRCVSNFVKLEEPFYCSDQSTGISCLSPFHESHFRAQYVDVITLKEYFADKNIGLINFLKVDTEGHDLFVLQGFPWEQCYPEVIECEFEDSKTRPLGYSYIDMANFLIEKDYTVYVSEWHPIIEYGKRHHWHCLLKYPCELTNEKAWGNLLAFRQTLYDQDLVSTFGKLIVTKNNAADSYPLHNDAKSLKQEKSLFESLLLWPAPGLKRIDENVWKFIEDFDNHTTWTVAIKVNGGTKGRRYVGNIQLFSDHDLKIKIVLDRSGTSDWEGTTTEISLSAGRVKNVRLCVAFENKHHVVKLQLRFRETKKLLGYHFTIKKVSIRESINSIEARIGTASLGVKVGNQFFVSGDYSSARDVYLACYNKWRLPMYKRNYQMVMQKLKKSMPSSIETDLMQRIEPISKVNVD